MARKDKHLVVYHLEKVSSDILENYSEIISNYIRGKRGIYALYSGDKLYYVGLATNMRTRLKQHRKDRHAGLWDRFSLYITEGDEHLRELESLVLRILMPKGNIHRMRFVKSSNLVQDMDMKVKKKQELERLQLFGRVRRSAREKAKPKETPQSKVGQKLKAPAYSLTDFVKKPLPIRASFHGDTFQGKAYKNGKVEFDGIRYNSLTGAAKAINGGKRVNGWVFWRCQDETGKWVKLADYAAGKVGPTKREQAPLKTGRDKSSNIRLAEYVDKPFTIRAKYKGEIYRARVQKSGRIKFNGNLYNSPSGAGQAIRNRPTGGWNFWSYRNEAGDWVKLDELRGNANG